MTPNSNSAKPIWMVPWWSSKARLPTYLPCCSRKASKRRNGLCHDGCSASSGDASPSSTRASRPRRNVAHHYDLDGRLYSLFLDADRQYSCAYFETPDTSLDDAQLAKKRHIAREAQS